MADRLFILDLNNPMRSLREAAGLTPAELAERRGVKAPTQYSAEGIGPRVTLESLMRAAEVAGLHLEITARSKVD